MGREVFISAGFGVCAGGVDILDRHFRYAAEGANLFHDLVDVGAVARVFLQHGGDECFDVQGEGGVGGEVEGGVEDGHAAHVFEGGGVVAEFVEQHSQGPDVGFLVDGASTPHIDHFRAAVLHRRMFLHVFFDEARFVGRRGGRTGWGGAAEVAEFVTTSSIRQWSAMHVCVRARCYACMHFYLPPRAFWLGRKAATYIGGAPSRFAINTFSTFKSR